MKLRRSWTVFKKRWVDDVIETQELCQYHQWQVPNMNILSSTVSDQNYLWLIFDSFAIISLSIIFLNPGQNEQFGEI